MVGILNRREVIPLRQGIAGASPLGSRTRRRRQIEAWIADDRVPIKETHSVSDFRDLAETRQIADSDRPGRLRVNSIHPRSEIERCAGAEIHYAAQLPLADDMLHH